MRVVVLILEKVPIRLRGELTRWMLEPKTGVFVGNLSGMVRDRLWEKACQGAGDGGAVLIQNAANEQGFLMRTTGDTRRSVEEFEGLALIRIPQEG